MYPLPAESSYPLNFREDETRQLARDIAARNSVELIGMKRVGISNFLRYVIFRPDIVETYVDPKVRHLFIPVDCNDLIEIKQQAFWTLVLKRIVDLINGNEDLAPLRAEANDIFMRSIQLKDLFYTIDCIRTVLSRVSTQPVMPTLFLIRFDRMLPETTPEMVQILKGIIDATAHKVSYVITTHRELHDIQPDIFPRVGTAAFFKQRYLVPAQAKDLDIICDTFIDKYRISLSNEQRRALITAAGGHVQYLQLSLIILSELYEDSINSSHNQIFGSPEQLVSLISNDERVILQSEEITAVLSKEERDYLTHPEGTTGQFSPAGKDRFPYLWNTGYINPEGRVFSQYLIDYLTAKNGTDPGKTLTLTRKEQLLFDYMNAHIAEVCERDSIIRTVWPECNEIGVSDWAVDRLVSRLRTKLTKAKQPFSITAVKTRGFSLTQK